MIAHNCTVEFPRFPVLFYFCSFCLLPSSLEVQNNTCHPCRNVPNVRTESREQQKLSLDALSGASDLTSISQGQSVLSGPVQVMSSSNFAWVKKRKDDPILKRSYSRSSSRSQVSALDQSTIVLEPSAKGHNGISVSELQSLEDGLSQPNNSFNISDVLHSRELSMELNQMEDLDLMVRDQYYGCIYNHFISNYSNFEICVLVIN